MPARKIGTSRFYMRGTVASKKGLKAQDAESSLEQDFFTLLEFDRYVHRYIAQPFSIEWKDSSGKRRKYTPDVIVRYKDISSIFKPWLKTTIFEVKPHAILMRDWDESREKYKNATAWAREFGCIFRFITEKDIRTPYLDNARFLMRYKDWRNIEEDYALFHQRTLYTRTTIKEVQYSTPRKLMQIMADHEDLQAEMIPYIWFGVCVGFIKVDLSLPLNMNTPIAWVDSQ